MAVCMAIWVASAVVVPGAGMRDTNAPDATCHRNNSRLPPRRAVLALGGRARTCTFINEAG
jgi:hypothetical protein